MGRMEVSLMDGGAAASGKRGGEGRGAGIWTPSQQPAPSQAQCQGMWDVGWEDGPNDSAHCCSASPGAGGGRRMPGKPSQ